MAGNPARRAAGPDQFERRKQPPALVAPKDAARDQLARHRRGIEALTAEARGNPQPFAQLPDLRHAMHGQSDRTAEHVGDLDLAEPGKDRRDAALDGGTETAWPRVPGGFRARPHQPVAAHDPEMIDAVAIAHRAAEPDDLAEALAQRLGHRAIAPDRQQRLRQPPQRRTEMDVAGQHDVRGAQPRRRRHDALANARRIDADDRRVLEDARACTLGLLGQTLDVFAAVDLKRLRVIDAVKIAPGAELVADTIDLPALDFGLEILAQHLQPADQRIAGIDVGNFQRPLGERDARHRFLGRGGADIFGALLRQRPQLAGILEADALDQFADRQTIARHHGAELMARRVPADIPAFEHGDAGAEAGRLQRHRKAGKTGADDADIDVQVERQARAKGRVVVGAVGRTCESLSHGVFLRIAAALVTLS